MVSVKHNIQVVAGTLSAVAVPAVGDGIAVMHIDVMSGTFLVHSSDAKLPATPGTGVSTTVTVGKDSITWLLSRGNTVPDGWQVAASDGVTTEQRSGVF